MWGRGHVINECLPASGQNKPQEESIPNNRVGLPQLSSSACRGREQPFMGLTGSLQPRACRNTARTCSWWMGTSLRRAGSFSESSHPLCLDPSLNTTFSPPSSLRWLPEGDRGDRQQESQPLAPSPPLSTAHPCCGHGGVQVSWLGSLRGGSGPREC